MPFYLKTIIDKQCIYGMKDGIVNAVGCTIPLACLTHDFNFFESLMRSFKFLTDNDDSFLVVKTHSSTCLSCSTFL